MKRLINAGAKVNEQDGLGDAPIHIAVESGKPDVLDLLLSQGADHMLRQASGRTALEIAQAEGKDACAALLASRH